MSSADSIKPYHEHHEGRPLDPNGSGGHLLGVFWAMEQRGLADLTSDLEELRLRSSVLELAIQGGLDIEVIDPGFYGQSLRQCARELTGAVIDLLDRTEKLTTRPDILTQDDVPKRFPSLG